MESSNGVGLMAVIAVSGSIAYVAVQAHKRLMTEFMKKVEFEFGGRVDLMDADSFDLLTRAKLTRMDVGGKRVD
ncbi:hypothetical protein ACLOJK_040752 [Asimina triloba]